MSKKETLLLSFATLLSIRIVLASHVIGRWQIEKTERNEKPPQSDHEAGRTTGGAKRDSQTTREIPQAFKTDFPLYDQMLVGENETESEADHQYPRREWLRMIMSKGIPIETYSHYTGGLSSRWGLVYAKDDAEELASLKETCNLPPEASWEAVVDAKIAAEWQMDMMLDAAQATDEAVFGGFLSNKGVFIPFRENTVYLQKISEDSWTITDGGPTEINLNAKTCLRRKR
jgi:hypothetical protein